MKPISLSLMCITLVACASASAALIDNGSFEVPATGKIADFRDASITGWNGVLNGGSADSGVEAASLTNQDGAYFGFLQPMSNFTLYQVFGDGYTATAGDVIDIDFMANGDGGVIDLDVILFWDNPSIEGPVDVIETQSLSVASTGALDPFNVEYTVASSGDFLGQSVGVAFVNTTGVQRWLQIDNVTASAVPEPSTIAAILGSVALGLAFWRRRNKR